MEDIGERANIIPLSVLKRMGDLEIEPTATTLNMEDKTCNKPVGTTKYVLIKISWC